MVWMDDPSRLDKSFRTFMKNRQELLMQFHGWPLLSELVRWWLAISLSTQTDLSMALYSTAAIECYLGSVRAAYLSHDNTPSTLVAN